MRIIGVLREARVYEAYNDRIYDTILEKTETDSRYRKYLGKGIEQHYLLKKLIQIASSFGNNII